MKFRTEQSAGVTYLVYEIQKDDRLDKLSVGMLTNNSIPGILRTGIFTEDSKQYIKYNISSKVPLGKFLVGILNKNQILGIFSSICTTVISVEEYMLEAQQLMLEVDNIYINVSTLESSMVVLPLEGLDKAVDFRKIFKGILFGIQFDVREDSSYIAKLSNYLNSSENFSVKDFRKFIRILKDGTQSEGVEKLSTNSQSIGNAQAMGNLGNFGNTSMQPDVQVNIDMRGGAVNPVQRRVDSLPKANTEPAKQPKEKKGFFGKKEPKAGDGHIAKGMLIPGMDSPVTLSPAASKPVVAKQVERAEKAEKKKGLLSFLSFGKKKEEKSMQVPVPPSTPTAVTPVIMSAIPQNAGETTVLKAMPTNVGETTVLGSNPTEYCAYLIQKKGNRRINISRTPFRLGKERSYVDYCIEDNSAVSRSHADIIMEKGEFFIVDNNSLNHTFVDGMQTTPGMNMKLQDGCKIFLADEEFTFHKL